MFIFRLLVTAWDKGNIIRNPCQGNGDFVMPKNQTLNLSQATESITFTAIPNAFLDSIAPTLNPSELRVMLYIYRHTLGFHKLNDSISYEQFLNGMVTRDRRLLDKGAGVSRNSLVAALASLENKALIKRQHTGKYGPVTITLQPAALYKTAEDGPLNQADKPLRQNQIYPPIPKRPDINCKLIADSFASPAVRAAAVTLVSAGKNSRSTGAGQGRPAQNLVQEEGKPARNSQPNPVQVLSEVGYLGDKNLVLTKETNQLKQNKTGQEAAASLALGTKLITNNVPGISANEASRLAEQAFTNGRDQAYIARLIRHVTGNPAIRTPAAVLTTLIRANEDRFPLDKDNCQKFSAPDQTAISTGLPEYRTVFKQYPSGPVSRPVVKKRIDFGKYENLSSGLPQVPILTLKADSSCPSLGRVTSRPVHLVDPSEELVRAIDPKLKYSLQEFDSRLAVYVRHLEVENNLLKIGFFGMKGIPEPELANWLPMVKVYYPAVTAIKIIGQTC